LKPIKNIFLLTLVFIGFSLNAQNIEFIENKGQWDKKVRFLGPVSAGAFYINTDGFSVLQHKSEEWEHLHQVLHDKNLHGKPITASDRLTVNSHVYHVKFENSNPEARAIPDKPIFTYNNYFIGNDPSKWASECKIYQAVTIKDIYPNIDVRYYSDRGTLKYDLIVRPGGRVSDIVLKYEGVDKLELRNRELHINTSVGVLKELAPYTYQYNASGKTEIQAKYTLRNNQVRFDIKNFDRENVLVIDPTLIFCSFSKSTADNWGYTATYGPDGSMFGGGIVGGQGFPTQTGSFQQNFGTGTANCHMQGGFDIGLIKLTPDGTNRVYATYLGGSGNEMPHSLIVDQQGNLIMGGRTDSPHESAAVQNNYPLQNGGKIGQNGGWDIVITKFNAAGTALIGSRRIGGNGDDGGNISPCGGSTANSLLQNYGDEARGEVNLDAAGNIYLVSNTKSTNFPVQNAFQNTLGGNQDGVVLKFNPTLSNLVFSSYLGGANNDAAYVLAIHPNGNIYVAGGTESANLPGSTTGTLGPAFNGAIDGFISVIPSNGSTIIRTTYIGTASIDQIYGIQIDGLGFPYIMGQTRGSWPIVNAPWNQANGKQFIAKLQPDLSAWVYSTAFGKGEAFPDISPVAFLVDRCENVYVSGWGGRIVPGFPNAGVQGLSVTAGALKPAPDMNAQGIGQDFYFFVLKRNSTEQLYGTFFGQNTGSAVGSADHVDGGTSRFDENGVIYQAICASCGTTLPFPTTPDAWAPTKPANANCNLAMVKIEFDLAGVGAGVQSAIEGRVRDTSGCVPLKVDFRDTVLKAVSYEWNFGDGSPTIATTNPDTSHIYTAIGTYTVMLVAIDPASCNIRDTSYLTIKVGDLRAILDFNAVKLEPCDSFKYRFDNLSVAPPARAFGNNIWEWNFGDGTPNVISSGSNPVFHNYASPGTYNVKLTLKDSVYCNFPDSIVEQVRVAIMVKADFTTPPAGCAPYNAVFNNISSGGQSFTWNFGDGNVSTDVSPTHLYQLPGTYIVTLTAVDSATCNITDSKSITITVAGQPTADFTASPQPPALNTPISFTNLSSNDAVRFKWFFGDGDSLITTSRSVFQHEYNATGTYNTCLIAINQANCPDTVCREVRTLIEPALDVPNAFTPTSGDVNSRIFVRGYGIAKMNFAIYARWGEKVFESNSRNVGWDGTYKGKLLPMDVYAYTLDVEFSDGTRTRKTGDITLIR
jgi:gliding motility-associated-like protein